MSLVSQTCDPTAYLGMRIQKRFGSDFYPGKVADYEVVREKQFNLNESNSNLMIGGGWRHLAQVSWRAQNNNK